RNILSFIRDKTMKGFFNYEGLINNPKIGDALKVRLEPVGNEGFHSALTIIKADSSLKETSQAYKIFEGNTRINDGSSFGFIEDVFIPDDILSEYKLVNGQ